MATPLPTSYVCSLIALQAEKRRRLMEERGWFFEPVLGIGLGFAGGAMIYLVMAEMLPEAIQEGGKTLAAWGVMLGLCTMLTVTNLINLLPTP